jgi:hypothetical protein
MVVSNEITQVEMTFELAAAYSNTKTFSSVADEAPSLSGFTVLTVPPTHMVFFLPKQCTPPDGAGRDYAAIPSLLRDSCRCHQTTRANRIGPCFLCRGTPLFRGLLRFPPRQTSSGSFSGACAPVIPLCPQERGFQSTQSIGTVKQVSRIANDTE